MDDMQIKSFCAEDHLIHIAKMFDVLRVYNMKLNLSKVCIQSVLKKVFGVYGQPTGSRS